MSLPGDFYKELEACLEREVMDAITAARKLVYTHFNRRCEFTKFDLSPFCARFVETDLVRGRRLWSVCGSGLRAVKN